MKKTIAYYALLYGKEYFAWSIRSIQDAVDEVHILYTSQPSFGHGTNLICPDTKAELQEELRRFGHEPIYWHEGSWGTEGAHRDAILDIAREREADQILVVDADEIWDPAALKNALDLSRQMGSKIVRARFVHFWRSIKWVCKDPALPARIINMKGQGEWYLSPQDHPVFHFGYAQSATLVRYKEAIHGHKSEWRPGWFENKFLTWMPGCGMRDVHPTCVDFWTPERTDEKMEKVLEPLLGDHPYWGRDVIA